MVYAPGTISPAICCNPITAILLTACSPQPAASGAPIVTLSVQPSGTSIPARPTEQVQPSQTPSPLSQTSDADNQVIIGLLNHGGKRYHL